MLRAIDLFYPSLEREAATAKPAARAIETSKGTGVVERFTTAGPVVKVGTETIEMRWSELSPEAIADFAFAAFDGKDVRLLAQLGAFTWAHKLRNHFFGVVNKVRLAGGPPQDTALVQVLLARAKERFGR